MIGLLKDKKINSNFMILFFEEVVKDIKEKNNGKAYGFNPAIFVNELNALTIEDINSNIDMRKKMFMYISNVKTDAKEDIIVTILFSEKVIDINYSRLIRRIKRKYLDELNMIFDEHSGIDTKPVTSKYILI